MALLLAALIPSTALAQPSQDKEPARIAMALVSGPISLSAVRNAERFVETPDHQSQQKTRTGHPVLIGAAIGATAGFVLNATPYRTGESVWTGAALMAASARPSVPGSARWFRAERFVCSLLHLGTM
jgi:hypothetical protein